MSSRQQLFRPSIQQKPGVFQPITGQATVVVTTAIDQSHVDAMKNTVKQDLSSTKTPPSRYKSSANPDVIRRVESHLIALKKKGHRRYHKGTGADLKIFTAINYLTKDDLLKNYEHVGVVQTPINPSDKTKPAGFETNATRIGGTVSLINTGDKDIHANCPVYWDAPVKMNESECGPIRGHPEGIIYPATRGLGIKDEVTAIMNGLNGATTDDEKKTAIEDALSVRRRIIGWSLNDSKPGTQLDLILKR